MIKLKQFLVAATIICGCGFLANLNSSTLAMMNNPQFSVNENLNATNAAINENNPQIHMNDESAVDNNNQAGEKIQYIKISPKEKVSIISYEYDSLEERDPTRPFCNCEKCKQYGRSKIFYKILYETDDEIPIENLENFKVTACLMVNDNIVEKFELHDAYIENTEDNCLIFCIPYDLPEGKYRFIIQYNIKPKE